MTAASRANTTTTSDANCSGRAVYCATYRQKGCPVSLRLREGDLVHVQVAGTEPRLGVSEVQRPHTAKRLVEAEPGEFRTTSLEARPPPAQRLGVVLPEAEPVGDGKRRLP